MSKPATKTDHTLATPFGAISHQSAHVCIQCRRQRNNNNKNAAVRATDKISLMLHMCTTAEHESQNGYDLIIQLALMRGLSRGGSPSDRRRPGGEHDRSQRGYMFITRFFITHKNLMQIVQTDCPPSPHPPHQPGTLHRLHSNTLIFLSRTNETVSRTLCFHLISE